MEGQKQKVARNYGRADGHLQLKLKAKELFELDLDSNSK